MSWSAGVAGGCAYGYSGGFTSGERRAAGRKVGDAERVPGEVARRLDLALETIERGVDAGAAPHGRLVLDAHVEPHHHARDREERAIHALRDGAEVGRHEVGGEVRVRKDGVEHETPDVDADLVVEVFLELERAPAGRLVARIECRRRLLALERGDDAGRVGDRLAVESEHRDRLLAGEPHHDRRVRARQQRAALVPDPLPVERPTHLLVEVRGAKLPEDGNAVRRCHDLARHRPSSALSSAMQFANDSRSWMRAT
jgi:hypothetical protein